MGWLSLDTGQRWGWRQLHTDEPVVNALAGGTDGMFVGGNFANAGGIAVTNIARWDGTNWHTLGGGWPGVVFAMAARGHEVFVGGSLTDINGNVVDCVRRWNGTAWETLGSGIRQGWGHARVSALLARKNDVFVGGRFTTAGSKPAASIARWVDKPAISVYRSADESAIIGMVTELGIPMYIESTEDFEAWTVVDAITAPDGSNSIEAVPSTTGYFRAVLGR